MNDATVYFFLYFHLKRKLQNKNQNISTDSNASQRKQNEAVRCLTSSNFSLLRDRNEWESYCIVAAAGDRVCWSSLANGTAPSCLQPALSNNRMCSSFTYPTPTFLVRNSFFFFFTYTQPFLLILFLFLDYFFFNRFLRHHFVDIFLTDYSTSCLATKDSTRFQLHEITSDLPAVIEQKCPLINFCHS